MCIVCKWKRSTAAGIADCSYRPCSHFPYRILWATKFKSLWGTKSLHLLCSASEHMLSKLLKSQQNKTHQTENTLSLIPAEREIGSERKRKTHSWTEREREWKSGTERRKWNKPRNFSIKSIFICYGWVGKFIGFHCKRLYARDWMRLHRYPFSYKIPGIVYIALSSSPPSTSSRLCVHHFQSIASKEVLNNNNDRDTVQCNWTTKSPKIYWNCLILFSILVLVNCTEGLRLILWIKPI